MSPRARPTAHARARARGIAGALVITSSVAAGGAAPGPRSGIGDLPARVVHAHAEFDVFVPAGAHAGSSFKCFAPIGLSPQVPLRVAVATVPAGEAKRWSYDKDGMLVVDLGDQTGEKHVALTLDVDVLLMESVGHDDVESTGSSFRKTAGAAQKPYLRPLAGTNPDDPDIAKLAATLKPKAQDLVALARAIEGVVHEKVKEGAAGHDAAGDALRRGSGGRLARANLAVALFLSQSVPVRLLGTVPARGSGSFEYLVDVNAGDAGWLRLDPLRRGKSPFPWSEREDVVLAEVNADTPIAAGSRPRMWFCGGGLTAGNKGASTWLCREDRGAPCPRSTAKQILPVLLCAFAAESAKGRAGGEVLDVAAVPAAAACRPLVEWLATLAPLPAGGTK
jgi:hypothetical protein